MAMMDDLVERFKIRILDTDPMRNILSGGKSEYTPKEIEGFIKEAWYQINETEPRTNFPLDSNFPKTDLLLQGAMIFMLRARGLVHLRNQISYNDAGFSVNLDDKAGYYAQWLGNEMATYFNELKQFKRSFTPRFVGVTSPMRWWNGR